MEKLWLRRDRRYTLKRNAPCVINIEGIGGKIGPDLSDVGGRRYAEWIKRFLKDPKSVNSQIREPPFKGTDEELDTVVAYLMNLKNEGRAK
jgi:cbb3-type cytochrome oxidase cytochrome c subunit